ncbi:MAG: hypothetical protein H6737_30575 [Alphaproteobacteria bacterium]|nr:hypothetical protein [Alphaproteobacteria bacterium]
MQDDLEDWAERVERSPADDGLRAVFLDWLLEHGFTELAEWARLSERDGPDGAERARLRDVATRIPARLRARLARVPVEDCRPAVPLSFECPKRWEGMQPTDVPTVRHCQACEKPVYWVDTVDEAVQHARLGHCVAVAPGLERPAPAPAPPWPRDIAYPPGTVAARPPIDWDRSPQRPPQPVPEPEPPKPSWWRRLFGW